MEVWADPEGRSGSTSSFPELEQTDYRGELQEEIRMKDRAHAQEQAAFEVRWEMAASTAAGR